MGLGALCLLFWDATVGLVLLASGAALHFSMGH